MTGKVSNCETKGGKVETRGGSKQTLKGFMLTMTTVFQIPSVQFAVANDSNYTFSGILGLGYAYPYSIQYPSVLNLMVSQKLIAAPIFSVGLGGEMDGFSESKQRK